jgi:hypothetical protein
MEKVTNCPTIYSPIDIIRKPEKAAFEGDNPASTWVLALLIKSL